MLTLTDEQRAVLAHVVVDPDAWVAHALAAIGELAVYEKIERHRDAYVKAFALPGYQNRVERDAAEAAEAAARAAARRAAQDVVTP
jgi:hypothetical protein